MRRLLLATTALLALGSAANVDAILQVNDNTPPAAPTTTSPVTITSQTQFFIQQTSNGASTPASPSIYFLDFPGGVTPTITDALLNGNALPAMRSVSWRIAGRARIKVSPSLRPDRTNPTTCQV